ncbi:hypothetical protein P280DRAFT_468889 [Massarina eburnea CBS 473.64]|uniref:Transcription factor Rba50 n=1 Tax=Massarina eburnea CBS 473.64 TaxID=1395130 RepID=A0A6A6S155_9PLEO|nr:hypothetical protein P280DRAFT_468889 [Massarina eburnea CBS 473.64]
MSQFVRGERVLFDLEEGLSESTAPPENQVPAPPAPPALSSTFVADILERPSSTTNSAPPVAPTFNGNANGFPAHKKRTPRVSAFKQRRAAQDQEAAAQAQVDKDKATNKGLSAEEEKRQIDEENRLRLANMSAGEIEEERTELLQSLPQSLIEKLIGRANIDEGSNERDWEKKPSPPPPKPTVEDVEMEEEPEPKPSSTKKVAFAEPDTPDTIPPPTQQAPSATVPDPNPDPQTGTIHFPKPTQPPDLDPNDPSFLTSLHEKYFPNLAYDPSQLSWMSPIDPSDKTSPYHPSHTAFNAQDLRFEFKGNLLAPSRARQIPVTKGLHHHADAPEAAGYTIPELAVMARSAVAAQRCVAFQTLGRILYRLGSGEFGFEKVKTRGDGPVQQVIRDPGQEEEVDEEDLEVDMEDATSAMAAGLWGCVEEGRVVETLTAEAARESGHLTSRTFAQEALWNWRRGGGRKRQAV